MNLYFYSKILQGEEDPLPYAAYTLCAMHIRASRKLELSITINQHLYITIFRYIDIVAYEQQVMEETDQINKIDIY